MSTWAEWVQATAVASLGVGAWVNTIAVFLDARRQKREFAQIRARIACIEAAIWEGDPDPDPGDDLPVDEDVSSVVAFVRRVA